MARFEADGKKLVARGEGQARRASLRCLCAASRPRAAAGQFPKGVDNFRWRFHGLFYVAPTQNSFMCRLRIPNGILTHWQLARHRRRRRALRRRLCARDDARQPADPRGRGRDGPPPDRGAERARRQPTRAGADNIRNVTGSPTAGIDPQELLDTRPYAGAWHHHILNGRSLYGLPRKFNVGFDGGGVIPVLEDTNDIAFTAVSVGEVRRWSPACGSGSGSAASPVTRISRGPTGVLVKPDDAVAVADAIVRVFIDQRRPHRPQKGAAQVRAGRLGLREIPRPRWRRSSAGR